jgi:predicted amidophosphoribosyltransferase
VICPSCALDFTPDAYYDVCNVCGKELRRQYERMQDFESQELTLAALSAEITFGVTPRRGRMWTIR